MLHAAFLLMVIGIVALNFGAMGWFLAHSEHDRVISTISVKGGLFLMGIAAVVGLLHFVIR